MLLSIIKEKSTVFFLRSIDDGNTWQIVATDIGANFSGFHQLKSNAVVVAGKNKEDRETIFRSSDDGKTWQSVTANYSFENLTFENLESGTVLAQGGGINDELAILRSADDGKTWQAVANNIPSQFLRLKHLKNGLLLAHGNPFGGKAILLRSADDGKTWKSIIPEALQTTGRFSRINIVGLESSTVLALSVNKQGEPIILRSDTVANFLDRDISLKGIRDFIDQNTDIPFMKDFETQVSKLLVRESRNNKALDDLRNGIEEFKNVAQQNVQGDAWTKQLHLQGTRVTVIALLIYLVQIYVTRYRYNIRLAAFYLARADALIILNFEKSWKGAEEYKTLVEALTPETMGFGKATSPSTQQMIQVASDLYKKK